MSWRVADSLITLITQVNALWPHRSRRSDGTIGDTAHRSRRSDHNPNSAGVVTARDITHDPTSGADMNVLAERLRTFRDTRIKYVIWDRRIFSSYRTASRAAWTWGPYTGSNPHTAHMHVSVSADMALYDDGRQWNLRGDDDMAQFTESQQQILAEFADEIDALKSDGAGFARAFIVWWRATVRAVRNAS